MSIINILSDVLKNHPDKEVFRQIREEKHKEPVEKLRRLLVLGNCLRRSWRILGENVAILAKIGRFLGDFMVILAKTGRFLGDFWN